MDPKYTVTESKWKGRAPRGSKDNNSFASFVAKAKLSKLGKEHLQRHHGGYGIK